MELASTTLNDFAAHLASDSPAPGGGSASAAAGAFGAGLLGMVVKLTLGKEKYKEAWEELAPLGETLDEVRRRLVELVDEDTRAYEGIVKARRLPKGTDDEKAARQGAIDRATMIATATPMQTAFFAHKALSQAATILRKGNPNAASDAYVAGLLLAAAVSGALANVRINLPGVDAEAAEGFTEDASDLAEKTAEALAELEKLAATKGL